MCRRSNDLVRDLVRAELTILKIKTQEDFCALAARASITVYGPIEDLGDIFKRSRGLAEGLFDEAFRNASEGQRWAWIDMCERALREANAEKKA